MVNRKVYSKIAAKYNLEEHQVKYYIRLFCDVLREEYFPNKIGVDIRNCGRFFYQFDIMKGRELKDRWREEGATEDEIIARMTNEVWDKIRGGLGYAKKMKKRRYNHNYEEPLLPILVDFSTGEVEDINWDEVTIADEYFDNEILNNDTTIYNQ